MVMFAHAAKPGFDVVHTFLVPPGSAESSSRASDGLEHRTSWRRLSRTVTWRPVCAGVTRSQSKSEDGTAGKARLSTCRSRADLSQPIRCHEPIVRARSLCRPRTRTSSATCASAARPARREGRHAGSMRMSSSELLRAPSFDLRHASVDRHLDRHAHVRRRNP
jgi:hypothetical protein